MNPQADYLEEQLRLARAEIAELRKRVAAAPAPVERVEQESVAPPVAWQHRKPIISDIHGNAKEWSDWIDGQGLAIWPHRPLYAAPQPAAPAPDVAGLVDALSRLERACDRRAALLTSEVYRMCSLIPGMDDALLELDSAREQARELLDAHQSGGAK